MIIMDGSRTFTATEKNKIERYLDAFKVNFFDPVFYRMQDGAILIFHDTNVKPEDFTSSYIQFCENADFCAGFLNGAVVQRNRHLERWTNGNTPEN